MCSMPVDRNWRNSLSSKARTIGEGLPTIGNLLGRAQVQKPARYALLARETVKTAAARNNHDAAS